MPTIKTRPSRNRKYVGPDVACFLTMPYGPSPARAAAPCDDHGAAAPASSTIPQGPPAGPLSLSLTLEKISFNDAPTSGCGAFCRLSRMAPAMNPKARPFNLPISGAKPRNQPPEYLEFAS